MEVTIKIDGQALSVEVSVEVYEYLDEAKHKNENLAHEKRRHWDIREFDEYIAFTEGRLPYSDPSGREFSMVFQFEHIGLDQQPGKEKWDLAPLDFLGLKRVLAKWQTALFQKGWNSLFWNNHDLPRIVSRWGSDGQYREESAKMLATLLYGLQGTPYIYQGEELGMTNAPYELPEYRDIETLNLYRERLAKGFPHEEIMASLHAKSRDNARTPMQWDDTENAGFTQGTPWMRVNPNSRQINAAEELARPGSVFSYYQRLVALRKQYDIFTEGDFTLLAAEDPDLFAYQRRCNGQTLLVAANFHGETVPLPFPVPPDGGCRVLIANYGDRHPGSLRPYEAFILLCRD